MDATGQDDLAFWLAWLHPAVMLVGLGMAGLGLRSGLDMRRRRRSGAPARPGLLVSHLRMVRPAVLLLLLGLVTGPASALWLRGWAPFGTLHAWLGLLAALLFASAGLLGLRLQRGGIHRDQRAQRVRQHGQLGALAMLLGALTAVAGMVLLP